MFGRLATFTAFVLVSWTPNIFGVDLSGTIREAQSGQPLPGVHISVTDSKYGTASDGNGEFVLRNLPDGDYRLEFRLIGYKKTTRTISARDGSSKQLDVFLEILPWELDEIVVTATRSEHLLKDVPVTTELITAEEIRETGALTVDQALESHIGVQVNDDLSGKGITLRGIDPSRVLILIDGRRVVGRVRGSIDLGQISVSDVEQIEIVKGSGSTLYGSDALGGVVNIITRKPEDKRRLGMSLEYGSFRTFDPEFNFESAGSRFGTIISGKYERTDGFDLLENTPHTNGLERIKRSNLDAKFTYNRTPALRNELTVGYLHEQKRWIESEWFEPLQRTFTYDDYEWNSRYDAGLSSKYILSEKTTLEGSIHGSLYDHEWEKYTASDALDDQSVTQDDILETSLQFNHVFSKSVIFTGGADFLTSNLESDQVEDGKKNVYSGDSYAQLEWIPLSSLTLLPGIRWEHHKTYGDQINPSINFRWSPAEKFALRGGAGKGFRAPSIKEIYFRFDHSAAGYLVYGGLEDLEPETSDNYSLTAELNYDRRGIHRLTVFQNDLSNLIDFDLVEYTPTYWRGIYRYQNIVKAYTQGLEWESKVNVCTGWDVSFSYISMTARNLTEDVKLINRPEHTAKFRSVFKLPAIDTWLTVWGIYTDHKLWTSQGDTPDRISDDYAPKRIVVNMILNKRISKSIEGYLRIENIGNDINAIYGYWPPRSYTAGLRFNLFNWGNDSPKGEHQ